MNPMRFSLSDMIAGYVTSFNRAEKSFGIKTTDGREFRAFLTPSTYARNAQNMEEPYADCTARLAEMLTPGQHLFVYGIFYPQGDEYKYEAKSLVFPGDEPGRYRQEEPAWWVRQVRSIANSYMKWQFNYPNQEIDYRNYRTFLHLAGGKKGDFLQETDTISRLVYGFASAYLMTGEDPFLEAAEKGTEYLREHMRFFDRDEDLIYWYHGIQVTGNREQKLLTSEFGDDYDSIPMYEQIYALAGPIQTYRVTGDPRAESLAHNRARKNWNSVGDHAPAYLINLWLATGEQKYADFLEYTFDTIVAHFPDYDHSPFVQERFYEDWSHDTTWGWQQNRAVVGHNLKIAWNLMRMQSLKPKEEYVALARKIAEVMPAAGSDQQRGGWYDVVERTLGEGEEIYRYVWHDRKAWWQQEQAILAYLILHGVLKEPEHLRHAREVAAFYNAFFLDHDDGGVYFNVLANGLPYLMGNERFKGSHSMSGYHSTELCYLSAVYTNLLITRQPMEFYFKPQPGAFKDNILRVQPDILPPGSIRIGAVWIDDAPYTNFDANALTVNLPETKERVRVKVRIDPTERQGAAGG